MLVATTPTDRPRGVLTVRERSQVTEAGPPCGGLPPRHRSGPRRRDGDHDAPGRTPGPGHVLPSTITAQATTMVPWLVTVARRIVINDLRGRRARPQEVDDTVLEIVPVPDDTERTLQRRVLLDALNQIGAIHRRVVVEMYFHGRTVEETARLLGVPPGTVKSRSFYAMRALRAALLERAVEL